MSNVINRITKSLLLSVNTPDYPIEDWIINPDLSSLVDVSQKYWKIVGDTVVEMTQEEKDAVDAEEVSSVLLRSAKLLQTEDFGTSSINWQTVLNLNLENAFRAGQYYVYWSGSIKTQLKTTASLRVVIDSVVEININNIDPNNWLHQSGIIPVTWTQDTHEISLQLASEKNNKFAQIKQGRLLVSSVLVGG